MKPPNPAQFEVNREHLLKVIRERGVSSLSYFCTCTGLPVYVACIFVKEEFPEFSAEMDQKIAALVEFYGYKV